MAFVSQVVCMLCTQTCTGVAFDIDVVAVQTWVRLNHNYMNSVNSCLKNLLRLLINCPAGYAVDKQTNKRTNEQAKEPGKSKQVNEF